MSGYKLVNHDEKQFVLQHPDGSHFKVAKKGLSAQHIDRIHTLPKVNAHAVRVQHFDDGGDVETDPVDSGSGDSSSGGGGEDTSPQEAPEADSAPSTPDPNATPLQVEQLPDATSGVPADGAPQAQVGDAQTPVAPGLAQQLQAAQAQEAKGVQGIADSQSAEGKKEAAAYSNEEDQLKAQQADYQQKRATLDQQSDQLFNDALQKKVDPNHYWNSQSTGNKVLAGISMVLGGAGGKGKGNAALDVINNAIERDIDAQKANIQQGNNLLSMNFQRTRNLDEAEGITRSQLLAITGAEVAKAKAQATGPQAQANADYLLGQLKEKAVQQNSQLAMQQAKNSLAQGGPGRVNPELLDKDTRSRLVTLPNGQQTLAPTAEDAKSVKDVQTAADNLQATLSEMRDFRKNTGRAINPVGDAARTAASLRNRAIAQVNHLAGLQRLSSEDIKLLMQQIPDPGAILQSNSSVDHQLGLLQNTINNQVQAHIRNHTEAARRGPMGITPKRPS